MLMGVHSIEGFEGAAPEAGGSPANQRRRTSAFVTQRLESIKRAKVQAQLRLFRMPKLN